MARRNKKGKEKKKKSLLTKLVVVGLVSYVVVALVAQQMELTNKRNELVQLQQKISEQTDANKDLEGTPIRMSAFMWTTAETEECL